MTELDTVPLEVMSRKLAALTDEIQSWKGVPASSIRSAMGSDTELTLTMRVLRN
jgi:hypothetical protein